MANYIVVDKPENLRVAGVRLSKPKTEQTNTTAFLRFFNESTNNGKELYVQTPIVVVGKIETIQCADEQKTYIELYIAKTSALINLIADLETYLCHRIYDSREQWGLKAGTPLLCIENMWRPMFRWGTGMHHSLVCELPMKSSKCPYFMDFEIFDQDNDELPMSLVAADSRGKGLIHLRGVKFERGYFSLDWSLRQLKIRVPDHIFDSCQLSAGSSEDTEIDEDYDEPIDIEFD